MITEPSSHIAALSALSELMCPFEEVSAGDIAARIDGRPAAAKLIEAVASLRRDMPPAVREDGRTWWPLRSSYDVLGMLRYLAELGPDDWGRSVVFDGDRVSWQAGRRP